jgi:putative oxidoreductase
MKKAMIVSALPRLLLGLLAAYGGVLHFTMNVSVWKNSFLSSLEQTNYLWQIIGIINFVSGVFLILNRYKILALLMLLPITFNIFLFHIFFFTTEGLFIGIPMFALNVWCLWQNRLSLKFLITSK